MPSDHRRSSDHSPTRTAHADTDGDGQIESIRQLRARRQDAPDSWRKIPIRFRCLSFRAEVQAALSGLLQRRKISAFRLLGPVHARQVCTGFLFCFVRTVGCFWCDCGRVWGGARATRNRKTNRGGHTSLLCLSRRCVRLQVRAR